MSYAAVLSKAVVLLLLVNFFIVSLIVCDECVFLYTKVLSVLSSIAIILVERERERERDGCFSLVVFTVYCDC